MEKTKAMKRILTYCAIVLPPVLIAMTFWLATARAHDIPATEQDRLCVAARLAANDNQSSCDDLVPQPVRFRPWQEVWQCNDLRVTITSNAPGMINYDIAGSILGGINFTMDGPRHQLYKGQWPCALVR